MATTLFSFEKRIAVIGFLFAVSLIGCKRGSGNPPTPPKKPTPAPTQSANWKLSLNQEKLGTTSDTSALSKMLSQVMKNRREQRVARHGTGQIETTIYLDAERAIGIGDVIKVVEVAKEAGALPVFVAINFGFCPAGALQA